MRFTDAREIAFYENEGLCFTSNFSLLITFLHLVSCIPYSFKLYLIFARTMLHVRNLTLIYTNRNEHDNR